MPGFEVIGKEEFAEIKHLFDESKILFRHSFDHLRNNIYKVKEFEKAFAERMKVPYALGVTSGTAALRVALAALDIKEGDEVITQSFTFVATVEAIIESRAIPVITEIDKTLNMDPIDLEKKITEKTKAIIVVHMLGVPARLKEIKQIADNHGIPLIEDTAWGCGGCYENIPLGTYGDIGTYSFDFAKTMTTGEGGMVVFKDKTLFDKAAAWHDHGHENNPEFPRWEDSRSSSGFNYRMNEMQGAVGLAQLKKLDYVVEQQRINARLIIDAISGLPIELRDIPNGSYETADALVFLVDSNQTARQCRDAFINAGLGTKILPEAITWHFAGTWDHMPELVKRNGEDLINAFPVSLQLLNRSVSLPIAINIVKDFPIKIKEALISVLQS
ncbi:MAG: DegT/DnrJ/EryC1/StrS family aminotransferase [Candidatus Marinimicrobia bacterium]|jgi:8-amino-3,8-dideoxy-alpha-D-manno-octulosonate transaminase|nr:DegT/DnrJ/EryC1/StrS family aminotransferase [Candidatus Neomarinimicrobiota bacterium]|tara:strand:+ start:435 stop:1595 length:1161 start_codon:yes stop_codon:yes gene_type:complete